MSSLTYINDKGSRQKHSDLCLYSQAIILGDIVKCIAQGGWTETGALNAKDVRGQGELAFIMSTESSVHADYEAGKMFTLSVPYPGHRPIWTSIVVPRLSSPVMQIESEIEAYNKKG
ncbi:hypothetical protein BDV29DRAFT_188394 [Aspergillus leporis]|uniref:Uncharacterized protein n=1 Tax=Aspergillus leporis TaxID=41062 RepID=A0A5N5XAQ8_9EURO|nr:hypothetical protein BDV29DRAFT_188394 [Aspergillus leporis]